MTAIAPSRPTESQAPVEPAHVPQRTQPTTPKTFPVGTAVRRGLRLFAAVVVAFLVFALWLSGLAHARSHARAA